MDVGELADRALADSADILKNDKNEGASPRSARYKHGISMLFWFRSVGAGFEVSMHGRLSNVDRGLRFPAPCIFLLVCVAIIRVPDLSAQTENAAITGRITDPQGRIVPDVAVQVVNIDTNAVYQAKTNGSGIYAIPSVRPGRYRLVLSKEGFKDIRKTGIELHVQDILEQDFALEVGSTSEIVTVTGESAIVDTTDAAVSTAIDRNFADNLPLNGRSFQSLIYLTIVVPGIQTRQ